MPVPTYLATAGFANKGDAVKITASNTKEGSVEKNIPNHTLNLQLNNQKDKGTVILGPAYSSSNFSQGNSTFHPFRMTLAQDDAWPQLFSTSSAFSNNLGPQNLQEIDYRSAKPPVLSNTGEAGVINPTAIATYEVDTDNDGKADAIISRPTPNPAYDHGNQ